MKAVLIIAGIVIAAAAALIITVNYAVGLGINRAAGFSKISEGDPEVSAGWGRYSDELKAGMDRLKSLEGKDIYMESFDGLKLYAKLCSHGGNPKGIVILSHGYRSSPYKDFSVSGDLLFREGYDLLIVSQRAQGKSEGRYICFGQNEAKDIAAWSRLMEERYPTEVPIYLSGVSMGATTVMLAMGEDISPRVRAVVADCGFSSAEEIVKHMIRKVLHLPAFPLYELVDRTFRRRTGCTFSRSTVPVLAESSLPLLLVHGKADGFVYPWMSEANYEASAADPADKQLLMIEGANHAQSFLTEPETVGRAVLNFLTEHR